MANAIKKISVQRGYDVTRYALNCFGGAGGQHACLVADALGMTKVLIHPFSSLLSAYGMGLADIRATRQQAIEENFGAKSLASLKREGARLGKDAKAEVAGQGVPAASIKVFVRAHIRYAGTDTALVVDAGTLAKMKSAFEKAHKARFGFIDRTKQLVIEAVSVEAVGGGAKFRETRGQDLTRASCPSPARAHEVLLRRQVAQGRRSSRASSSSPAHKVKGPAIVIEPHQTVVVEHGWRAEITAKNHLVSGAHREAQAAERDRHQGRSDHARGVQQPVHVDRRADGRVAAEHRLFGEHQGAARLLLRGVRRRRDAGRQRAAHAGASRLDGPRGRNHHPREQGKDQARRRLSASTRPTTAAPTSPTSRSARRCSTDAQKKILFWVASRGHHADIGGIAPGSMSPIATSIEEEGIYIDNFKLVDRGTFREKALYDLADQGAISGAQPAAERQRPQGADRRQREGRAGTAQDGGAVRPCRGARLHEARAGQRRRKRAPRDRPRCTTASSATRPTRATSSRSRSRSTRRTARQRSISPAPRRSRAPTSTRPSR